MCAVVLGEDEIAGGTASVKWLRGTEGERGQGRQQSVPLADLTAFIVDAVVADDGVDEPPAGRTIH